ncbi:MAG: isoprenylcysteine carboxylmethyltransferase family protein [Acetobacteraceae bacterium]|jgi:protein-S-isoprenylcysteine O-methyltransferase Ste14
MRTLYTWLIPAIWSAWGLYWCIAALTAKPVRRRESMASRLSHYIPLLLAILLLVSPRFAGTMLDARFLPWSALLFWTGTAVLLAGLFFSVAARRHLGGNWSGSVTLKQGHTLTRSGPYRFVRHPIYTGLLLAIFGSGVIALGEWRGLLALALVTAACLRKVQIEERFLLEQFGDAYARYRQEVAALVPGVL